MYPEVVCGVGLAVRFGYYWVASLMGVIGVKLIVAKESSKRKPAFYPGQDYPLAQWIVHKKRVVHLTDAGYMCSI